MLVSQEPTHMKNLQGGFTLFPGIPELVTGTRAKSRQPNPTIILWKAMNTMEIVVFFFFLTTLNLLCQSESEQTLSGKPRHQWLHEARRVCFCSSMRENMTLDFAMTSAFENRGSLPKKKQNKKKSKSRSTYFIW